MEVLDIFKTTLGHYAVDKALSISIVIDSNDHRCKKIRKTLEKLQRSKAQVEESVGCVFYESALYGKLSPKKKDAITVIYCLQHAV